MVDRLDIEMPWTGFGLSGAMEEQFIYKLTGSNDGAYNDSRGVCENRRKRESTWQFFFRLRAAG